MAAACGKLPHVFDKAIPDNPTLMESLSWNHVVQPMGNQVRHSSLTEIFGGLYFKEVSDSSSSSASSCLSSSSSVASSSILSSSVASSTDLNLEPEPEKNSNKSNEKRRNKLQSFDSFSSRCYKEGHKTSDSFSSMSSDSLQLCTEGLGFESSDTSEDLENGDYWQDLNKNKTVKHSLLESPSWESRRSSRVRRGPFPPPISSIGKSGKPWVCFKSCKQDGRFVLKEIRIPNQECLHASREDGRLKLHFVHGDDGNDDDEYAEYENQEDGAGEVADEDGHEREEVNGDKDDDEGITSFQTGINGGKS